MPTPSTFTRFYLGLVLLFAAAFSWLQLAPDQWGLIFVKTLRSYDESLNATVAANLWREAFPPAVRLNPLLDTYVNWLEGPLWQHIPPLFLYVPLPFFALDGGPSPEGFRLSYALVELATGAVFIAAVARFTRSVLASGCAFAAAIAWAATPFTQALVNGERFGVSDTVLAFATTCAFAAVLSYLARKDTVSPGAMGLLGLAMAFPLLVKHVLGAIPAVTLAVLMLRDRQPRAWIAAATCVGVLGLHYGALYLSSPETFRATFGVAFAHVGADYEGWARPWHQVFTVYLPQEYLRGSSGPLFLLALGAGGAALVQGRFSGRTRQLLQLSLGWFLWNLAAISAITSKAPNFIFQTYLFGLFFALYACAAALAGTRPARWLTPARSTLVLGLGAVLALGTLAFGTARFHAQRAQPYTYRLPLERLYHVAEAARSAGWGPRDLVLVKLSDPEEAPPPTLPNWLVSHRSEEAMFDFWGRYPIMFLTGAETWLYDDFRRMPLERAALRQRLERRYDRLHVVLAQEKPWPPFPAGSVKRAERVEGVWLVSLASPEAAWVPRLPPHPHPLAPRWP